MTDGAIDLGNQLAETEEALRRARAAIVSLTNANATHVARIAALEGALRPFAERADRLIGYNGRAPDHLVQIGITAKHCIAAARALSTSPAPADPPEEAFLLNTLFDVYQQIKRIEINLSTWWPWEYRNDEDVKDARETFRAIGSHLAVLLGLPSASAPGVRCQECGGPLKPNHTFTAGRVRCDRCVGTVRILTSPASDEATRIGLPPAGTPRPPAPPFPPPAADAPTLWGEPRSYLTDDRDEEPRNVLTIEQGGNGDWYVSVHPEGEGNFGRAVRICTSGGAASAAPGLPTAIAAAYRVMPAPAIGAATEGKTNG